MRDLVVLLLLQCCSLCWCVFCGSIFVSRDEVVHATCVILSFPYAVDQAASLEN